MELLFTNPRQARGAGRIFLYLKQQDRDRMVPLEIKVGDVVDAWLEAVPLIDTQVEEAFVIEVMYLSTMDLSQLRELEERQRQWEKKQEEDREAQDQSEWKRLKAKYGP